jgi:Lrp/AsnC family transcriptional regulator, regulator for asnA, asnC and gidA
VADPQRLGYTIDVFSGLHVSPGQQGEVAQRLATFDPVRYVALTTGSYDVLFEAMFRDQDELLEFLTRTLPGIPGIVRSETWHSLKVVKRNYDWLPGGDTW